MKIKLVDYSRETEYDISQDVTIGGVYEVLNEACFSNDQYFEIIDDDGWGHLVLQRDCVIVHEDYKEEVEMNVGDRVKVLIDDTKKLSSVCLKPMDFCNGVFGTLNGPSSSPQYFSEECLYSVKMDKPSCHGIGCWDIPESCLEILSQEPVEQASTYDTKDNTKTLSVNDIIYFTEFHKDLEISFESGKIHVRDWAGAGDPVEYVVEDAEQLEELVDTLESLNKFKV